MVDLIPSTRILAVAMSLVSPDYPFAWRSVGQSDLRRRALALREPRRACTRGPRSPLYRTCVHLHVSCRAGREIADDQSPRQQRKRARRQYAVVLRHWSRR